MYTPGIEYWGLHFLATLVAAYAVVLAIAWVAVGLRRFVGRGGQTPEAATPCRGRPAEDGTVVR